MANGFGNGKTLTMLTGAIRAMVNHQGRHNVAVWNDEYIVLADTRSPRTVRNLGYNPMTEANLIDPLTRNGYRFKGRAPRAGGESGRAPTRGRRRRRS